MAINQARSNRDLEQMILPLLKKAVDYVAQKIWNENRETVRQVVYEAYFPTVYDRTGEFKEAWSTDSVIIGNKAVGIFEYAPNEMSVASNGQHSSVFDGADIRPYLAEIIYQGLSGDFGYGEANRSGKHYAKNNQLFANQEWAKRRNAWKILESKLGASKLKKWMMEGFDYVGLKVESHATPWGIAKW